MSNIKCFDVLDMVVGEANKKFAPQYLPDESLYGVLKEKCNIIDKVLEEFDGTGIDAEIDEKTMQISISIECEDLTLDTSEHHFYDILEVAQKFTFSVSDDKNLYITMIFPPIWNPEM